MKRLIALFLCAVLVLSLAACARGASALDITKEISESFAFNTARSIPMLTANGMNFIFRPK